MASEAIDRAISKLYDAFSSVPKPRMIDGCPCCVEEKELEVLLSTPRRKITPNEMAPYASSVMLTAGAPEDLRYFLPRILEIHHQDPYWFPDIEIVFRALALADWHSWPKPEQDAIRHLVDTVFDEYVTGDGIDADQADSWLCAVARAEDSPLPYLEKMVATGSAEKLRQLHEANANALAKDKLANAFWPESAMREVMEWYKRPDVKAVIDAAYADFYLG